MAKGEWQETTDLIDAARGILDQQQPMTIRQLFYQLVSKGLMPNEHKHYQKVSRIMTKARDDGRVPFEYITDRSRPKYSSSVFENVADYAETVRVAYRKDYWITQPYYVEVWTEKDAIIGSIEPVTNDLGVTVRVGRGFLSTTRAHEIAQHFQTISKPIRCFYLGDHDPSGRVIETDLFNRIVEYGGGDFELTRVAIFKRDIATYKLPPLRIKDTDTRAESFRRKHGKDCVELDAFPADMLRWRLRNRIEDLLDKEAWERQKKVEAIEIDCIKRFGDRMKKLQVQQAF